VVDIGLMSSVLKRSRRHLVCLAALSPLLLASTARADDTPGHPLAAQQSFSQLAPMHTPCDDSEIETPFTSWSDDADYFLNRQGDVSDGAGDWTLDGSAAIAAQDNAYTAHPSDPAASISLGAGDSATAPTTCVTIDDPSMRFFVRNTGSETGTLRVDVTYTDENGAQQTGTLATLTSADAGDAWTPSPVVALSAPLVAQLSDEYTPVKFSFTAEGEGSAWLVDDVYVDPYGKG
jgi:hypothetical protein